MRGEVAKKDGTHSLLPTEVLWAVEKGVNETEVKFILSEDCFNHDIEIRLQRGELGKGRLLQFL